MKYCLFLTLLISVVIHCNTADQQIAIITIMVFTPEIKDYHLVEELIRDASNEKFQPKQEKEYFVKHWENK
jgi:hypothetical protein